MRSSIPYWCDAPPVSYSTPLDWHKIKHLNEGGFRLTICQNGYVYNPPPFSTADEAEKEALRFTQT